MVAIPKWWPSEDPYIIGDALSGLANIPDSSVDLILTDPPYNISRGAKITRNGGKFGYAKDINLDYGEWDHNRVLPGDYLDEFVRVLTQNGVLVMFYDRLYVGHIALYLEQVHGFKLRHIGAWVKRNPVPQARKVKWQVGTELFVVATKNTGAGHHFNYKLGQSPDYFVTSISYKHHHPTQKPLELFKWIISYWSFEGDIVLDPFLGAGTTLVACIELRRVGLGFEIDPDMERVIRQRMAAASSARTQLDKYLTQGND